MRSPQKNAEIARPQLPQTRPSIVQRLTEFFLIKFFPARADIGLLVLRVSIGATLLMRHGWERPDQWQHFVTNFPILLEWDPMPALSLRLPATSCAPSC